VQAYRYIYRAKKFFPLQQLPKSEQESGVSAGSHGLNLKEKVSHLIVTQNFIFGMFSGTISGMITGTIKNQIGTLRTIGTGKPA